VQQQHLPQQHLLLLGGLLFLLLLGVQPPHPQEGQALLLRCLVPPPLLRHPVPLLLLLLGRLHCCPAARLPSSLPGLHRALLPPCPAHRCLLLQLHQLLLRLRLWVFAAAGHKTHSSKGKK
jgi:hypothetical protein